MAKRLKNPRLPSRCWFNLTESQCGGFPDRLGRVGQTTYKRRPALRVIQPTQRESGSRPYTSILIIEQSAQPGIRRLMADFSQGFCCSVSHFRVGIDKQLAQPRRHHIRTCRRCIDRAPRHHGPEQEPENEVDCKSRGHDWGTPRMGHGIRTFMLERSCGRIIVQYGCLLSCFDRLL